ncbi:MAG: hypothetical protein M3P18_08975 [Actinomycetota bacterium]|nr:hypothetical protein [Actinomycetota bacterium]
MACSDLAVSSTSMECRPHSGVKSPGIPSARGSDGSAAMVDFEVGVVAGVDAFGFDETG